MLSSINDILSAVEKLEGLLVELARRSMQTPSLSGEEGKYADLLLGYMRDLGYDVVYKDHVGNVVGELYGTEDQPAIMFNTHLDHVDPGSLELWRFDPYSGEIADGKLYGRGAADTKGATAAMIIAGAAVAKAGVKLQRSFLMTSVVMEEMGECLGMRHLMLETLKERQIQCIVSGEATSLNIAIGHRGRAELEISTRGKTAHASAPWRGVNAVYKMAPILLELEKAAEQLPEHPFLGKATMTVTNIYCKPGKYSIIPDQCTIYLDRRLIPGESLQQVVLALQQLLQKNGLKAEVRPREVEEQTYTGYREKAVKYMPPLYIDPQHSLVQTARKAVESSINYAPEIIKWDFATDLGWAAEHFKIPSIGFSPCEEHLAHTENEYIRLDYLKAAAKAYAALIVALCC